MAYRGPYEYSVPEHGRDFTMQAEPPVALHPIPIDGPHPSDKKLLGLDDLS